MSSTYVVVGMGYYPENGFELLRVFVDEEVAELYADSEQADQDAEWDDGWPIYTVKEVPFDE